MNTQDIEKRDYRNDGSLEVHLANEYSNGPFYTIQGEGPNTGIPSIFVRLKGCNLQCPGCDTDYTSRWQRMTPLALRDEILAMKEDEHPNAPLPLIVITGGEPFRQNITPFCHIMLNLGFKVQVETNGTLPPDDHLDPRVQLVVSPKTGKINPGIEKRMTVLKYVVRAGCIDRSDGLPIRALDHTCSPTVAKPPEGYKGRIYLQPMDEGSPHATRKNTEAAAHACMAFGHTLQIQTHKVVGIA